MKRKVKVSSGPTVSITPKTSGSAFAPLVILPVTHCHVSGLESGGQGPTYLKSVQKYRDVENVTCNKTLTKFIHGSIQQTGT